MAEQIRDPYSLPPGPERRELLYAAHLPICGGDFTTAEMASIDYGWTRLRAAITAERIARSIEPGGG